VISTKRETAPAATRTVSEQTPQVIRQGDELLEILLEEAAPESGRRSMTAVGRGQHGSAPYATFAVEDAQLAGGAS
jgi:hypothetical protein